MGAMITIGSKEGQEKLAEAMAAHGWSWAYVGGRMAFNAEGVGVPCVSGSLPEVADDSK
jgi:hypothetical protein